jgi:hypothetical protein
MRPVVPLWPLPLWPLPLVAGLLPAIGTLIALAISIRLDLIPACNPFFDGCVSVSRAARYDLANHVFRALALPGATLQGLTWIAIAFWLRPLAPAHARSLRWLPPLGVTAAVAFIAYGTFLGTEGQTYRWLRQYGTVIYFGFTCLCMIAAGGAIREAARTGALHARARLDIALLALAVALVTLGVVNAALGPLFDLSTKDRIENVTEWWGSLIFTVVFLVLALLARGNRLALKLSSS